MPNFSELFGGGGIKSIQRGITSVTGGTEVVVPITAVNPAYTELRLLGVRGYSIYLQAGTSSGTVALTGGGTSVTVNAPGTSTNPTTVSWELTEFYPS